MLRISALSILSGVGDKSLGEWEEWTGKAYHIRRRLSPEEQLVTGDAIDLRQTPEAKERLQEAFKWLQNFPNQIIHDAAAEAGFSIRIQ